MERDRIVAIGLLTQNDVALLGPTFDRIWPVSEVHRFDELLRAIDSADCALTDERRHPSRGFDDEP